jgi:hypothetical protein
MQAVVKSSLEQRLLSDAWHSRSLLPSEERILSFHRTEVGPEDAYDSTPWPPDGEVISRPHPTAQRERG